MSTEADHEADGDERRQPTSLQYSSIHTIAVQSIAQIGLSRHRIWICERRRPRRRVVRDSAHARATVRLGECMGEWRRLGSVGYYKARISLEGIPSARGGAMATAPAAPDRIRRAGAPRGNPHRGHRTRSTWPILLMVTRCDATAQGTECAGCSRDWRVATRILPPAAPSSDDTRLCR